MKYCVLYIGAYFNNSICTYFDSIEVGNCTAVQVCMVQIPLLVIANAIHVSHIHHYQTITFLFLSWKFVSKHICVCY